MLVISYNLEMTVEVVQGSTHNLGDLTLWCRLSACGFNPLHPLPKLISVTRTNQEWTPKVRETNPEPGKIIELLELLEGMGWPGRPLNISVNRSALAGWQQVGVTIRLNGRKASETFILEYAGFSGPDAHNLRNFFRLVEGMGNLPDQGEWILGTANRRN